jgi:hypothetical protein
MPGWGEETLLPVLGIGSSVLAAVFALGGLWYYQRLRRLRHRGVIVNAKVVLNSPMPMNVLGQTVYLLTYTYGGVTYRGRPGMMERAVRPTLRRAWSEKLPVSLLIDPLKPTRYVILPLQGGAGEDEKSEKERS